MAVRGGSGRLLAVRVGSERLLAVRGGSGRFGAVRGGLGTGFRSLMQKGASHCTSPPHTHAFACLPPPLPLTAPRSLTPMHPPASSPPSLTCTETCRRELRSCRATPTLNRPSSVSPSRPSTWQGGPGGWVWISSRRCVGSWLRGRGSDGSASLGEGAGLSWGFPPSPWWANLGLPS